MIMIAAIMKIYGAVILADNKKVIKNYKKLLTNKQDRGNIYSQGGTRRKNRVGGYNRYCGRVEKHRSDEAAGKLGRRV